KPSPSRGGLVGNGFPAAGKSPAGPLRRGNPSPSLPFPLEGKEMGAFPAGKAALLDVVVVRVRDQGQEARALDRGGELALVARLGARDAAGDDLAVLGPVLAQGVEILVVDLLDALGGELAVLAAAKE